MGLINRLGREEPAPPWGLVSAIGYIIGAFACIVLGTSLASSLLADSTLIVGWSIGMVAIAMLVTITRNRTPQDGEALRLGASHTRIPLIIILLLSIGVAIAIDLLSLALTNGEFPTPELLRLVNTSDRSFVAWGLAALFMVILQPAGEELVFRGIAFPALRTGLGIWPGYLMTAVFYAVFHLLAYAPQGGGGNSALVWVSIGTPFLSGLYLTGIRAYTGSTRAALIAHAGLGLFLIMRTLLYGG